MDVDDLIKTTKKKIAKQKQYSLNRPYSKSIKNAVVAISKATKMNGSEISKTLGISAGVVYKSISESNLESKSKPESKKIINSAQYPLQGQKKKKMKYQLDNKEESLKLFEISDEIHSFMKSEDQDSFIKKEEVQHKLTMRFKTSNGITVEFFS